MAESCHELVDKTERRMDEAAASLKALDHDGAGLKAKLAAVELQATEDGLIIVVAYTSYGVQ